MKMSWLKSMSRSGQKTWLAVGLESIPILFHVFLVTFLSYYIVVHNYESPAWIIAAFVIDTQILLNWIQFTRNRAIVRAAKGTFPGYVHRFPSMTSTDSRDGQDASANYDNARRSWKECDVCDLHVPLRTHHCSLCRRCIYVPDHHCYFLGHCIGRTNQRFFIVFCFYACIGSLLGAINLIDVMSYYRDYASVEIFYYLLPFSTVMYFFGDVAAFELLYVALIDFGIATVTVTTFLNYSGFKSVFGGNTPYEIRKNIRYEEIDTVPAREKFKTVFGKCGLLHFFIPFVPFEAPTLEPGYRRIITYNNDYYNGSHTSKVNVI